MKQLAREWMQITLVLILVYLLVRNWQGATAVLRQAGNTYSGSVKTLQGR